MKGHVPTPPAVAEEMVQDLFEPDPPTAADRILYPGAGTGPFAAAVERVCEAAGWPLPDGLGVELNPEHLTVARERDLGHVTFREQDFLSPEFLEEGPFDYVIGNPPYVPIEDLSDTEKKRYRETFDTAVERFDLYLLFFERAMELLADDGQLSLITPEKFEYTETSAPLRKLLTTGDTHVTAIRHLPEGTFDGHIAYPCVTTVRTESEGQTRVTLRDGSTHMADLPKDGASWAAAVRGFDDESMQTGATLGDITERISPGMATGADSVFVTPREEVPPQLEPEWIYPTVSGSQLRANGGPESADVFICPYREDGSLPSSDELGAFGEWAALHRERLEDRSCIQSESKPWYAWHETPPMIDLLQSKIVFQDITDDPQFWPERNGDVVPRHTVYYLIPRDGVSFDALLAYLNSSKVQDWLAANCQKAANGYLRLQSRVLEDLPVPRELAESYQATL